MKRPSCGRGPRRSSESLDCRRPSGPSPGGQALARYVLDRPQIVAGRRVLDFASGSGLVAITAAKAGAGSVEACDIDAFAIEAIALNAAANAVSIKARLEDLIGRDEGWDAVLVGDICYERDTAERASEWLYRAAPARRRRADRRSRTQLSAEASARSAREVRG